MCCIIYYVNIDNVSGAEQFLHFYFTPTDTNTSSSGQITPSANHTRPPLLYTINNM